VRKPIALTGLAGCLAIVVAAVLMPAGVLADTGVVLPDCAPPLPMEKALLSADLIFLGTVTSTEDGDRTATVVVKEVWQGDVDEIVSIRGGAGPGSAAEDDRTYSVGSTYLFFPTVSGDQLVDNACTSTREWSDDMAAIRPAVTRPPRTITAPAPSPFAFLGSLAGPLWTAAIIGGGAYGFALLVARRRDD
jgi:hypothetical protein